MNGDMAGILASFTGIAAVVVGLCVIGASERFTTLKIGVALTVCGVINYVAGLALMIASTPR